MPLELGTVLSIEREPVLDPEIRVQALETIYLISLQVKSQSMISTLVLCVSNKYKYKAEVLYVLITSMLIFSPITGGGPKSLLVHQWTENCASGL